MKIISVLSKKGGVGKTTTLCLVAQSLARRGYSVALRDLDRQRSATAFVRRVDEPGLALHTGGRTADVLAVDSPGGMTNADVATLAADSDLLLIPMAPTPLEIRGTRETKQLLGEACSKTRLVFNRVNTATTAFKQRYSVAEALDLVPLDAHLGLRIGFGYAMSEGIDGLDAAGRQEIDALTDEIITVLDL